MEPIILNIFHTNGFYSNPHFFILNPGKNTGNPSPYPTANTYICISKNKRMNAITGHGIPIHFLSFQRNTKLVFPVGEKVKCLPYVYPERKILT